MLWNGELGYGDLIIANRVDQAVCCKSVACSCGSMAATNAAPS
jgi:hypothetical protein